MVTQLENKENIQYSLYQPIVYGRQMEMGKLLAAFERACQGGVEIVLIAGDMGIGKSSLLSKLAQIISQKEVGFICSCCGTQQPSQPYALWMPALQMWLEKILMQESSVQILWRQRLLQVVGDKGQILIEILPDLEHILGAQPHIPTLTPVAAQFRFDLVFCGLIQVVFATETPLVILLDDLQWVDTASLRLLKQLLLIPKHSHLLLVAVLESDQLPKNHPVYRVIDLLQNAHLSIQNMPLMPIKPMAITQMLNDWLGEPSTCSDLSQWLYQQTHGNPFLIREWLLHWLGKDEVLVFKNESEKWFVSLEQLPAISSVHPIELIQRRVKQLPIDVQNLLQWASCLGGEFPLKLLALVCQKPRAEIVAFLQSAQDVGLIVLFASNEPLDVLVSLNDIVDGVMCRFSNPWVQEAVYSLISAHEQGYYRSQIEERLLEQLPAEQQSRYLFDLVRYISPPAVDLPVDQRTKRAGLFLLAGQQAKALSAYKIAFTCFQSGLQFLMDANSWQTHYQLTLSLYLETAEMASLNNKLSLMERLLQDVMMYGSSLIHRVQAHEIKIQGYLFQNQQAIAIEEAFNVLDSLGVRFRENPTEEDNVHAIQTIMPTLLNSSIDELLGSPEMTTLAPVAALRILAQISMTVWLFKPTLFPLLSVEMIKLSLRYGNGADSAIAYASLSVLLAREVTFITNGIKFGQLAEQLLKRFDNDITNVKASVYLYAGIMHWQKPLKELLTSLLETYKLSLDVGELLCTKLFANMVGAYAFMASTPLTALVLELKTYSQALLQFSNETEIQSLVLIRQIVGYLQGDTPYPSQLKEQDVPQENDLLEVTQERYAKFMRAYYQLLLGVVFQEDDHLLDYASEARTHLVTSLGTPFDPLFHFWDSLVCLTLYDQVSLEQRESLLHQVVGNQEKMEQWSEYAPFNFKDKFVLVEAERARIVGEAGVAREFYDQAILMSQEQGYLLEEGLACELAARFYLERGQDRIAQIYLQDAQMVYQQWGAMAKVKDLQERYPHYLPANALSHNHLETVSTLTGDIQFMQELDVRRSFALDTGDGVIFYTGQILEATNPAGISYTLKRLQDVAQRHWHQPVPAITEAILADIQHFTELQTLPDDWLVWVVKQP